MPVIFLINDETSLLLCYKLNFLVHWLADWGLLITETFVNFSHFPESCCASFISVIHFFHYHIRILFFFATDRNENSHIIAYKKYLAPHMNILEQFQ